MRETLTRNAILQKLRKAHPLSLFNLSVLKRDERVVNIRGLEDNSTSIAEGKT